MRWGYQNKCIFWRKKKGAVVVLTPLHLKLMMFKWFVYSFKKKRAFYASKTSLCVFVRKASYLDFCSTWIKKLGAGLNVAQIHRIYFMRQTEEETLVSWKAFFFWKKMPWTMNGWTLATRRGDSMHGGDTWSHRLLLSHDRTNDCLNSQPEVKGSLRFPSFFCNVEMSTDCSEKEKKQKKTAAVAESMLRLSRAKDFRQGYMLQLKQLNSTRRCHVFFSPWKDSNRSGSTPTDCKTLVFCLFVFFSAMDPWHSGPENLAFSFSLHQVLTAKAEGIAILPWWSET